MPPLSHPSDLRCSPSVRPPTQDARSSNKASPQQQSGSGRDSPGALRGLLGADGGSNSSLLAGVEAELGELGGSATASDIARRQLAYGTRGVASLSVLLPPPLAKIDGMVQKRVREP